MSAAQERGHEVSSAFSTERSDASHRLQVASNDALPRRGCLRAPEGLSLSVHPHMLRHACGFYLASRGHDTRAIQAYLGHRQIQRRTLFVPCFQHGQIKDLCSLY